MHGLLMKQSEREYEWKMVFVKPFQKRYVKIDFATHLVHVEDDINNLREY